MCFGSVISRFAIHATSPRATVETPKNTLSGVIFSDLFSFDSKIHVATEVTIASATGTTKQAIIISPYLYFLLKL